jgi:hypothetical protein
MLDYTNIGWVVDLGDITNGGGSTSTFVSVSTCRRSGKTKKLVSYASKCSTKTLNLR